MKARSHTLPSHPFIGGTNRDNVPNVPDVPNSHHQLATKNSTTAQRRKGHGEAGTHSEGRQVVKVQKSGGSLLGRPRARGGGSPNFR